MADPELTPEPLLENVYPKLLGATTFVQRPELADSVRAAERGRTLPSHLSAALEQVARTTTTDKADV